MKKLIALFLIVAMTLSMAACSPELLQQLGAGLSGGDITNGEVPTLTVYPYTALNAGIDTGFRSQVYKNNGFQVNVWAWSAEKTNSILVSGNLPDIMYVAVGEDLDTLIQTKKIINLEEYLDQIPHLYDNPYMEDSLQYVRDAASNGTGSVYGLPVAIGTYPNFASELNPVAGNILKLKWDAYKAIGSPEIKDYWQLLDVMEDMLEAMPTHPDGTKMVGTVLNSGFDSTHWGCMTYWFAQQGYMYSNLKFMLEINMKDSTASSILNDNSMYYQGLKWYNQAMRRGLIDPDSMTTDRGVQATKVDNGYVMVPMGSLPGYPGGGYYPYYLDDTTIYYPTTSTNPNYVMVINANTQHLDACLKYLNMMCDPDQVFQIQNGLEGDIWERQGDGIAYTAKYKAWIDQGNPVNGFPMSDGSEYSAGLNLPSAHLGGDNTTFKDVNGNPVTVTGGLPGGDGPYKEMSAFKSWQEDTGYDTPKDMIDSVDFVSTPEFDLYKGYLSLRPEDDVLYLTQTSLKSIVCDYSWRMVYAQTDAEFEQLWSEMVTKCKQSGAQQLIDWRLNDMKEAKEEWEANK